MKIYASKIIGLIIISVLSSFYYLRLVVKTFADNGKFLIMLNVKFLNNFYIYYILIFCKVIL